MHASREWDLVVCSGPAVRTSGRRAASSARQAAGVMGACTGQAAGRHLQGTADPGRWARSRLPPDHPHIQLGSSFPTIAASILLCLMPEAAPPDGSVAVFTQQCFNLLPEQRQKAFTTQH